MKQYKVRIEASKAFTLFIATWATVALVMSCLITYGIFSSSRYDGFLLIVAFACFLLSSLAFNLVRWRVIGVEILQLREDGIFLTRTGTVFKKSQLITFNEMDSIEADDDIKTRRWIKLYKLGGGKIIINYLSRHTRFGQSLSYHEAQKLAGEIAQAVKEIKS